MDLLQGSIYTKKLFPFPVADLVLVVSHTLRHTGLVLASRTCEVFEFIQLYLVALFIITSPSQFFDDSEAEVQSYLLG